MSDTDADAAPAGGRTIDRHRHTRGRLSTIDLLPEECDEDIAWANEQLRDRGMPANEIHRQFNARLADKGIKGISVGAFSRHSVRLANEIRKMDASRRITDVMLARLAPGERTNEMIAATELLKHRVTTLVMDEEADPKLLNIASLALHRLSSIGVREEEFKRRNAAEQREAEARAAQEAAQARAAEQAAEDVTRIATEVGLSADRVRELRRGVLGLAV